ncbi:effector-associated constant component EACC1 [Streptomyces sp. KR55]|uniref:effector-associated constant component EACC1 n=1 Tax=Streptomyces sp. KR55 TaxID=3457425 RepID=UPI003FD5B68F
MRTVITVWPDGAEELRGWLLDVPDLRGRIHRDEPATPQSGAMGPATDALVALLEPGGVAAVFAGATVAWVQSRRSNHTITITRSDGSTIEITTRQTRNLSPQELAELAERLARPPGEDPPA